MKTYSTVLFSLFFLLPLVGFGQEGVWDARLYEGTCGNLLDRANAVAVIGDTVFVGLNGSNGPSLMKWPVKDGVLEPLYPEVNGAVYTLEVDGNNLIVGGKFSDAGGVAVHNVAIWNGTSWSAMGENLAKDVNGDLTDKTFVRKIVKSGSGAYALVDGNGISSCQYQKIWEWDGFEWHSISEYGLKGSIKNPITGFCGDENEQTTTIGTGRILTIAEFNSCLFIGGTFTTIDDNGYMTGKWLARRDGTRWVTVPVSSEQSFEPNGNDGSGGVLEIVSDNEYLYVGGYFKHEDFSENIIRYNGSSFISLGGQIGADNGVKALHISDGYLYIGGLFNSVDGVGVGGNNKVARWTGSNWEVFGGQFNTNSDVLDIASGSSGIYVVGDNFTGGKNLQHWTDIESPYCPKYLDLSQDDVSGGDYQAAEELSSSGSIDNTTVTFSAGSAVILKPDPECAADDSFTVTVQGAESFTAWIQACTPPPSAMAGSGSNTSAPVSDLAMGSEAPAGSAPLSLVCYPNPLYSGDIAKMSFHLPQEEEVYLSLYSLDGRQMRALTDGLQFEEGDHTIDFSTSGLGSGIYFVLLRTPSQEANQKLVVLD